MCDADVIVVGAGLWGCTLARRFAEAGRRVLVYERREAVGGNCRAETDSTTGIEIHRYGSHIFHTDDPAVWAFVSRFTTLNDYRHRVIASWRGETYPLPVGLPLLRKFFKRDFTPASAAAFMSEPQNAAAVSDAFFRGYTAKQWGVDPDRVDPAVLSRVRVRYDDDVSYFTDRWQGIPADGYTEFFRRLLDHPGIEVRLGSAFGLDAVLADPARPVCYSGPVDELFGFRFGPLPWRTLRFETERLAVADFQGTSVVNHTEAGVPYTRVHEFKHFHPEWRETMARPETVICREYPAAWRPGDEPYYPVNTPASRELLARYRAEAAKIPNLILGGRLGAYCYHDMDDTIASALSVKI